MSEWRRRGFLAGATGVAGAALPWTAQARQSPTERSDELFPLVADGAARAHLVWWGRGSAPFAAGELRDYVQEMTGVRLRLHRVPTPDADLPEQLTGAVALLPGPGGSSGPVPGRLLADAAEALADTPQDTFAVLVDKRSVLMTGLGDRAPLYAAYAALEQCGVRYFAPGFPAYEGHAELVPRTRSLALPGQRLVTSPAWRMRRSYVEEGYSHNPANLPALIDWMAKNRLNTLVVPTDYLGLEVTVYDRLRPAIREHAGKRGLSVEVGGHGYDSFLPPEEYPEFYRSGGPLFDVYNPEALDAYVEKVLTYLRERPEIGIFDCWPPDVWEFQKEILDRYGTASNAESVVVNALAEAVREQLPGVRVERIAYASTLEPPEPEYASDRSVLVDFAPISRTYAVPLDDASSSANAEAAKKLRAWRSGFRGTLSMYEYYRRYRWRSLPVHPMETVAADVDFEARLGLDGMGMYCEPADWIPYEPVQRLVAALAWDPSLDAGAHLDGWLHDRFGAAAAPAVRRYLELTRFDPDAYDGTAGARRLRDAYTTAGAALREAAGRATDAGARLVLDRLHRNVRIAVADMEIGTHPDPDGDPARKARRGYRALVMRERFNGVCLAGIPALGRWSPGGDPPEYDDAEMRQEIARAYGSPAAAFLDPQSLTVPGGGRATFTVVAQDVDFAGHTVEWTARAPDALTLRPDHGVLHVRGTHSDEQEVTLTAAAGAGEHQVDVTFRVRGTGGAQPPSASLRVTVA